MSSGEAVSGTRILSVAGGQSQVAPALLALFFGVFMVGMVGFAPISVLHNAAHDTRHSAAFPCH